ncbi:hypothetical protein Sjap_000143 [Stephania japonica]|uniref:Uncharacterized protein n=1 Tax=Stephania japonica TaxID=461633 RepID=A0AAP0PQ44_9MAGN
MKESNFLYHLRLELVSPYKLFFNLQTKCVFPVTSNPSVDPYKSLPPNHHGGMQSSHLTAQAQDPS